ncbi:hypothetical protein BP6252_02748 [Coleophoma cylindrospora]|uniref:Uncharacterized protein n=1 Tax=Coleophoma cylindrospora TaxID=1849047 RepID=A0A3D8SHC7_9HELO|nr:hypothetical protein BP6252_02748 [Coleophoma cylindrospora]
MAGFPVAFSERLRCSSLARPGCYPSLILQISFINTTTARTSIVPETLEICDIDVLLRKLTPCEMSNSPKDQGARRGKHSSVQLPSEFDVAAAGIDVSEHKTRRRPSQAACLPQHVLASDSTTATHEPKLFV